MTTTGTKRCTERHHFRRMIVIWVVLSAVGDPLFYFAGRSARPPGAR